jgi:hypothetical protein
MRERNRRLSMRYDRARGAAAFLLFSLPKPFVSRTASADGPARLKGDFAKASERTRLVATLPALARSRFSRGCGRSGY